MFLLCLYLCPDVRRITFAYVWVCEALLIVIGLASYCAHITLYRVIHVIRRLFCPITLI